MDRPVKIPQNRGDNAQRHRVCLYAEPFYTYPGPLFSGSKKNISIELTTIPRDLIIWPG